MRCFDWPDFIYVHFTAHWQTNISIMVGFILYCLLFLHHFILNLGNNKNFMSPSDQLLPTKCWQVHLKSFSAGCHIACVVYINPQFITYLSSLSFMTVCSFSLAFYTFDPEKDYGTLLSPSIFICKYRLLNLFKINIT